MKIAVPTDEKKGLEDTVAEHFGRARNFLIYDTETKISNIYANPEAAGEAQLPPDFLHGQKVDIIIVFNLGPKAYDKFKNYNVKMYKATKGTIQENLEKFKNTQLEKLKKENIF